MSAAKAAALRRPSPRGGARKLGAARRFLEKPAVDTLEAHRQQALLEALFGAGGDNAMPALRDTPSRAERGMQAYRANGGACAERALAAAYPTLQQLLGEESFAQLARALWHAQPPVRGDLALFGDRLFAFIAEDEQLAGEPYLADLARLEWALHRAQFAADAPAAAGGFELLGQRDPAQLRLQLRPGIALISSRHPIVSIWQAHQVPEGGERTQALRSVALAREAMQAAPAEHALVFRRGWQAAVTSLAADDARFTQGAFDGLTLAVLLDAAGGDFDFERWLLSALREGWLTGVIADGDALSTE